VNIYIKNHQFQYEIENLTRLFFPNEKIMISDNSYAFAEPYIITERSDKISVTVKIGNFYKTLTDFYSKSDSKNELSMASMLYKILCEYSGIKQPWGILTGVRPIKLLRSLIRHYGEEQTRSYFKNKLFVSDKKIDLAFQTESAENKIIMLSSKKSFSLYVSIPFCNSICSYCSFVSQSITRAKHLMQPYTQLICKELKQTAQLAEDLKLNLESVYIGGGTPTALDAVHLEKILDTIATSFNMDGCREFTVEAGRPDTITGEKLAVLKSYNVNRISINPQTFQDDILVEIGRNHSSAHTYDAFELARNAGFECINMDLIAGLPKDTVEGFSDTLDKTLLLNPENVTVHSLALKRSAVLSEHSMKIHKESAMTVWKMLDISIEKLNLRKYKPYYLYRQSKMVGNCENIGFTKQGQEGFYNVFSMDETHSIFSCGAGGVTKLKQQSSGYIERIFNFKYPYEYINRFDEITARKEQIRTFHEKFN